MEVVKELGLITSERIVYRDGAMLLIWRSSYEVHEDPDFVLTSVHEDVVHLVEVVHHLQECDQFLFVETR